MKNTSQFGCWVPVSERLPDKDALYIVHAPSADPEKPMIHVAWYEPNGYGWSILPKVWIDAITHWMPMPDAPRVPQKTTLSIMLGLKGRSMNALVGFLTTWMTYIRDEQAMTTRMNVSYMPGASAEYRRGRADGLRLAESTLGLLAYEQGIDLRDAGKSNRN